jgi:hypothetical protein
VGSGADRVRLLDEGFHMLKGALGREFCRWSTGWQRIRGLLRQKHDQRSSQ